MTIAALHEEPEALIELRTVGKAYRLYDRPQDRLHHFLGRRFGRSFGREFLALQGVSLEVRRGEALAIVGRNGGGKSTLLQLIAGVSEPTSGEMCVRGRVNAILEIGSGFNPEFTGRENVRFAAALLGMSPAWVRSHFDRIAKFADIGDFIDQPVKVYSSGMQLRLAFAVQTALPTDVLLVDEALAVGDEAFQRKCFAYMEDFRRQGGALVFVSHSVQTIVRVATRALLLEGGHVLLDGDPKQVTDAYHLLLYGSPEQREELMQGVGAASVSASAADERKSGASIDRLATELPKPGETSYGNGDAEIVSVEMQDEAGRPVNVLKTGQRCRWVYRVRFVRAAHGVAFGMMLKTVEGVDVAGVSTGSDAKLLPFAPAGSSVEVRFELTMNLVPGYYLLNAGVAAASGTGSTYLHRRVDVQAIRVIPGAGQQAYGLAFLDPEVRWQVDGVEVGGA